MNANHEQLEYVQRRVARGEYEVNSDRVAAAMLERIGTTISNQQLVSRREGGRVLLQALSVPRAA